MLQRWSEGSGKRWLPRIDRRRPSGQTKKMATVMRLQGIRGLGCWHGDVVELSDASEQAGMVREHQWMRRRLRWPTGALG
jgi:hypothetical protein